MKQKDIGLIIAIVFISGLVSYLVSNKVFVSSANRQQEVDVVQPITADFPQPDKRFFNSSSYDPTQLIKIGQNNNTNPFNAPSSSN